MDKIRYTGLILIEGSRAVISFGADTFWKGLGNYVESRECQYKEENVENFDEQSRNFGQTPPALLAFRSYCS